MKYIDNRLNANIVKLEDRNNNYTSENVEGALEEIDSKIKDIESQGYDDTKIKQDINNIKTEIGTEELTTTDQTIKGAVNEIDSQIKDIKNKFNADEIKLEDANNNYTSENVEGALEEIDSKIKSIEANGYDDTQIRQDINNIKTEIGTAILTTTDQTIKGAVNEIDSQINKNMNNTNYVSVKSYGAVGDGVNDDTQAIQKCLNENNNVLFNDGIFNITSNLNIKSNHNILGLNGVLRSYTDNVIGLHGENVNNVTIDGLTFRCLEDGTGGLFNAIKIFNASNITLKNLDISTRQFGIFIHDIRNFTIENILFNQVRTTSYSNKDGIHINGNSHFGDIRNIKGTTDDDIIALNADEPFKNYGDISNITIDGVYSINKQSNGINNGTYQGIRFLSIVSKIYKINIKNCYIKADYCECFKITGYEENKGKYGEITIEDCHFYQELSHGLDVHTAFIDNCNIEKLTLRNITFEKPSINGSFIRTNSTTNINEFIIDNVKFKNTSETPFILMYLYGVIDNLTVRNINFRQNVNSALCVAREGTINTALFDGISINNCQNIFRSTTGSLVNDITFSNIKLNSGNNICEITNNSQIKKIFTSNIQCTDTTSCVVISTQQDNLRILQNNINGVVNTITKNTSNLGNVSVKGAIILFKPTVYNLGDEYCYVLDGVLTKKIYNGSYWVDLG